MSRVETTLRDRLASVVTGLGYEFVGCEMLRQGRSGVLRIYIDTAAGVTLDDCSRVSHQVSAMLDVEDPIQSEYSLEISSPGLNRPLFEMDQYKKQVGQRVKLRTSVPIEGQRNFVGILQKIDESDVHLLVDAEEVIIPFSGIEKASVVANSA